MTAEFLFRLAQNELPLTMFLRTQGWHARQQLRGAG